MSARLTLGPVLVDAGRHDLLGQAVDAIVNPANEHLAHGGGLAAVIAAAAGPELVAASAAHARVRTGDVAVTSAGRLPQRAVIHAVGPVWHGGDAGEPALLARAHRQVIAACADHGYTSVALPAISCGVFGYPVELAAPVAVGAVAKALAGGHPSLRHVRFCLASDAHEAAFTRALTARAATSG